MKILLDLIINPNEHHGVNIDHRFTILEAVGYELVKRGHQVWQRSLTQATRTYKGLSLPPPPASFEDQVDLFIGFSPYITERKTMFSYFKKSCAVVCYDHSWLRNSVLVDPNGIFSDSKYYHTLNEMVQENFDYEAAEQYRNELLDTNVSKRPQAGKDAIPDEEFIFFPGQMLYDSSIVNFSREGLFSMLDKTVQFAKKKNLHVVFKPHPNCSTVHKSHGKKEITRYCQQKRKEHSFFHVIDAPIYELIKRANYTVCVNCGSVMDNIITQTPVLCGGEMYLTNTDAVLYYKDVPTGLETIHNQDYDTDLMKTRQLQVLWWAKNNLLLLSNAAEENINRLSKHLEFNL